MLPVRFSVRSSGHNCVLAEEKNREIQEGRACRPALFFCFGQGVITSYSIHYTKLYEAQEVHAFIRALIEKKIGNGLAKSVRIQYGGSVKPENIAGLMQMPDIDGVITSYSIHYTKLYDGTN